MSRLSTLKTEFDGVKAAIETIERAATDANRDVSDQEQQDIDKLFERATALKPLVEKEAERQDSLTAVSNILARTQPQPQQLSRAALTTTEEPMTAGEWMTANLLAKRGDQDSIEKLRAVATMTTADNAAILPIPIIGPVIKMADSLRPVWNSFTHRPMPGSGKQFSRPRITQRVLIAEQMAELAELATRKMTVTGDTVTKRTFGGVLEISEQDIDWTDPSAWSLLLQDFVDTFAEVSEAVAVASLVALATTDSDWTSTNIGTLISSITTGIGTVYTASKRKPDTLWLSMDEALTLAGLSNATTNVSAMTLIKQALSDAGMPLQFVVGPLLPAGTRILGSASYIEGYEDVKGLIQAPDVSHLGVVMAYRGYLATYGLAGGFVNLANP